MDSQVKLSEVRAYLVARVGKVDAAIREEIIGRAEDLSDSYGDIASPYLSMVFCSEDIEIDFYSYLETTRATASHMESRLVA